MSLTVKHLRELLARPECRDDMPVLIQNVGVETLKSEPDSARIDVADHLVITVYSLDPMAQLPWKREREGRPGDRFDHNGCTVEVESQADGNVYYRASGKHGNQDCQNTIEEFHRLVTKAMEAGAVFTAAT